MENVSRRKILEQYKEYFGFLLDRNKIFKDDKFINWLESKIQNNERVIFKDSDDSYPNILDQSRLLKTLYNQIGLYATENSINPVQNIFDFYYLMKLNDNMYKIGVIYDLKNTYYCERFNLEREEIYIDYEDIRSKYYTTESTFNENNQISHDEITRGREKLEVLKSKN